MANDAYSYSSVKNDRIITQLANSMAELVEQSDLLLSKMKDIKKRDEELEKIEHENQPKCDEFSRSKYQEFRDSKIVNIEDVKEFLSAKEELNSIKSKRLQLEEEAKKINEERALLTAQISETYAKIVDLANYEEEKEIDGIYVEGLGNDVQIIDTYVRDIKDPVNPSVTEIIRTSKQISDAIYQDYSKNITTIESEPVENYSETRNLISELNEIIRIQNINIDSQIPLLPKTEEEQLEQETSIEETPIIITSTTIEEPVVSDVGLVDQPIVSNEETQPIITSEPVIEQPIVAETPILEQQLVEEPIIEEQVEEKPVLSSEPVVEQKVVLEEPIVSENKIINLENIINEEPKEEKANNSDNKIITINVPYSMDPSDKIANSNKKKYENIENNFKKITPFIVLERIAKQELSVSVEKEEPVIEEPVVVQNVNVEQEGTTIENKEQQNEETKVMQMSNQEELSDPIANFLNPGTQAA